jgi:4-hydroxybenzoate polyprenyltransferase
MAVDRGALVAHSPLRSALELGRAVAVIRRLEFYVVELTIFTMPLLLVANSFRDLGSATVLEGLAMYFVLYALGDMVNCLADRDLDREYKQRLSRAVYRLGVPAVTALVVAETALGIGLAIHLSATTGRWAILGLVLVGVFLGLQYSLRPLHLKSRGIGHLICLWLLLYFLPMLCAALLLEDRLGAAVIALAAAYATAEMGIILVNTSEDLPEDRAAGVRTTTVALGLPGTLRLATLMAALGGAALCALWAVTFAQRDVAPAGYLTVLALAVTCVLVCLRLGALARAARADPDETAAVKLVKAHGALVPVAATAVGWVSVICGVIALVAR